MQHNRIVCLFILLMLPLIVSSQEARISILPDSISIGQQARLRIEVDALKDQMIVFPIFNDSITSEIEVISYGKPDTLLTTQGMTISMEYTITSWNDGYFPVPPIELQALNGNDTLHFETMAQLFEVSGVKLDYESGLKDIRPILEIPLSFAEIFPYFLGLIVIGALSFFLFRYFRQRGQKKQLSTIWQKPDIPAHIAAISSLEKLRARKLWQNGQVKLYHTELTMILKMFLQKRFGINAPEMTSSEISLGMEPHILNDDILSLLRGILEQSDMVKFAKHLPEDSENDAALEMAIEFVRVHIPQSLSENAQNKQIVSQDANTPLLST
jgi:hypothetical protein